MTLHGNKTPHSKKKNKEKEVKKKAKRFDRLLILPLASHGVS
jgi:hypothetical protein